MTEYEKEYNEKERLQNLEGLVCSLGVTIGCILDHIDSRVKAEIPIEVLRHQTKEDLEMIKDMMGYYDINKPQPPRGAV